MSHDPAMLAADVLEMIGGRAEAEVRVAMGVSSLTRFANSFIHQNVGEEGHVVSLRVADAGRVASGTTTNVDSAALVGFVERILLSAEVQPVDAEWPGLSGPADIPSTAGYDERTANASPADRAERVKEFVAAGPGLDAAGYCETVGQRVLYANSTGHTAEGRYTRATIDGIHQTGTSAGSGHATTARLSGIDAAAAGELAARRARDSAATFDIKPGDYEVVLSPECVASITVFLSYYGYNAKLHAEGQSFVQVGTAQFDEAITIVDDVLDPRAFGIGFDVEGTPRRRVELVREGVSVGLAHDRRTAAKAGVESTGHAVPGSEVYGPFPSTVFVSGGDQSVEDLIAGVDRGLYVATFNYCRVLDPKTMVVTGLTRNGTFMIENGRITGPVSNLRFTQSFLEALGDGNVAGLGDDARWADSEFGAGLIHAPSLALRSWHFTGGVEG
jgi:predicted Zn-dependent protease